MVDIVTKKEAIKNVDKYRKELIAEKDQMVQFATMLLNSIDLNIKGLTEPVTGINTESMKYIKATLPSFYSRINRDFGIPVSGFWWSYFLRSSNRPRDYRRLVNELVQFIKKNVPLVVELQKQLDKVNSDISKITATIEEFDSLFLKISADNIKPNKLIAAANLPANFIESRRSTKSYKRLNNSSSDFSGYSSGFFNSFGFDHYFYFMILDMIDSGKPVSETSSLYQDSVTLDQSDSYSDRRDTLEDTSFMPSWSYARETLKDSNFDKFEESRDTSNESSTASSPESDAGQSGSNDNRDNFSSSRDDSLGQFS